MLIVSMPPPGRGFIRQRINKSGTFEVSGSSWQRVTGWTSDSTFPAIINANRLQVSGSGEATLVAHVQPSNNSTGEGGWRLMHNSTQVAVQSKTDGTGNSAFQLSWTGLIVAGDFIELQAQDTFWEDARTAPGTYIEVVPV